MYNSVLKSNKFFTCSGQNEVGKIFSIFKDFMSLMSLSTTSFLTMLGWHVVLGRHIVSCKRQCLARTRSEEPSLSNDLLHVSLC